MAIIIIYKNGGNLKIKKEESHRENPVQRNKTRDRVIFWSNSIFYDLVGHLRRALLWLLSDDFWR